jgi:hypothetical protein
LKKSTIVLFSAAYLLLAVLAARGDLFVALSAARQGRPLELLVQGGWLLARLFLLVLGPSLAAALAILGLTRS